MSVLRAILRGAAAGAAGTSALNTVTYLDMAVRGRPASSAPQSAVETIAGKAGIEIPGEGETHDNRISGLGPLIGIATGVGMGVVLGLVREAGWRPGLGVAAAAAGFGAMAGSDAPMAVLGISDPRKWSLSDWLSDVLPHLAYGLATAATVQALEPRAGRGPFGFLRNARH